MYKEGSMIPLCLATRNKIIKSLPLACCHTQDVIDQVSLAQFLGMELGEGFQAQPVGTTGKQNSVFNRHGSLHGERGGGAQKV